MQYLHLKAKAELLTVAFVCKYHFEAMCTGKDGLRWVTFSDQYVDQLIAYYYIFEKLEHMDPEKQQDNSEKDNGSKHREGLMKGEGMLDKIGIAYWMSLPNTNCRKLSQ